MSISSLLLRGSKKGIWGWNDQTDELQFESLIKEKKMKKKREIKGFAAINGLTYVALKVNLTFRQNVSENEIIEFRHVIGDQGRVTIEDCKMVAIFLCVQELPNLFLKFYDLTSVNHLLRACIVYIQFYLKTCETVVKSQDYLRGNPIKGGKKSTDEVMMEDLDDLRALIGRFYAVIIFTISGTMCVSKTDEILLFEYFVRVSSIVVWIALERKYLDIVKIELERIFRSGFFNNFTVYEPNNILYSIKKENFVVLHGKIVDVNKRMVKPPNRLTANTPIIHNFLKMSDGNLLNLGKSNFEELQDERFKFLTKYIFVPETEIQDEGMTIGILGLHKRLFDPLLYPCSKRNLKLLVTGSPMDISEERRKLREIADKKSQRESEPQSPHIFDELPNIPRPNTFGGEGVEETKEDLEVTSEETGEEDEEEDEYGEFEGEDDDSDEDNASEDAD